MPRKFGVVTDSTADLPPAWRERYEIEVVPLTVLFGSVSYRDREDLTDEEFFAKLAAAKSLPTTSAPSPGDFEAVYRRLSDRCDGCISIHLGSNLSATTRSAELGAQALDGFPVHVVDTRITTMPLAFLCKLAAESGSLEEAVARVRERIPKLRIIALLDTLRYVEMGGRVSRAQALLGSMLDLKPILGVAGGEIRSLDRVRTRGRAIPRLLELLLEDMPLESVAVMHAQAPEEAARIVAQLEPQLPGVELVTGQIGCVLATHTGPRALGMAYIKR